MTVLADELEPEQEASSPCSGLKIFRFGRGQR